MGAHQRFRQFRVAALHGAENLPMLDRGLTESPRRWMRCPAVKADQVVDLRVQHVQNSVIAAVFDDEHVEAEFVFVAEIGHSIIRLQRRFDFTAELRHLGIRHSERSEPTCHPFEARTQFEYLVQGSSIERRHAGPLLGLSDNKLAAFQMADRFADWPAAHRKPFREIRFVDDRTGFEPAGLDQLENPISRHVGERAG